jgi:nicotinamidase-related amidase
MATNLARLDREHAQLLIVDIQEKLIPHIQEHGQLVAQAERMIRAASVLDLPITLSEQYTKGLGATVAPIRAAAETAERFEKMTFSSCADGKQRERLTAVLRPQVLIVGIETHVCVLQTALDLLAMQMRPVILADAVGSRRRFDYEIALDGLRAAGAVITTVEAAIFQLVHESGTELFKRILPLVR